MELINSILDAFKNASEFLFGWTQFIPSYLLVPAGLIVGFIILNAVLHIVG